VGAAVVVAALLNAGPAHAQDLGSCGPLANAFGPFDYRKERGNNLRLVESAHFTPKVEALAGSVTGYIGQDIDYTLRAFPNHPRALLAVTRLAERMKVSQVPQMNYEVECYYTRATALAPDDVVVRMLYATFLNKKQRRDAALRQLAVAKQHAADNPFTHFNLGMSYLELGAHDEALVHAHQALELGFPRMELKDRLVALNKWAEPKPPNSATTGPAAPASAASAAP
jgi:tetratricopeptide (TPR) repeat protein